MPEDNTPLGGALLLAIDLQPVFINAIHDPAGLVKRTSFALECARLFDLPVGFTEQVPGKLGGTDPELLRLSPNPHVFGKTTFSGIGDAGILDALRTLHVEHLIVCGLETSICVYLTAVDAINSGFQVTVLSDAVACRRPADGQICLDALTRAGACVLPAETVFYSIIGTATHPSFKAYTQLVKKYA